MGINISKWHYALLVAKKIIIMLFTTTLSTTYECFVHSCLYGEVPGHVPGHDWISDKWEADGASLEVEKDSR